MLWLSLIAFSLSLPRLTVGRWRPTTNSIDMSDFRQRQLRRRRTAWRAKGQMETETARYCPATISSSGPFTTTTLSSGTRSNQTRRIIRTYSIRRLLFALLLYNPSIILCYVTIVLFVPISTRVLCRLLPIITTVVVVITAKRVRIEPGTSDNTE